MTRSWLVPVLLAGLLGCRGFALTGSLVRPVAGSVYEDLVAVVDEPVEQRFGDDGVGEQRIPVDRRSVAGQDQRPAGSFGDQLVEVVYLGSGDPAESLVPGAVGAAAGQVSEGAAGLDEPDLSAVPDGEVTEGLGNVAFADADGPGAWVPRWSRPVSGGGPTKSNRSSKTGRQEHVERQPMQRAVI